MHAARMLSRVRNHFQGAKFARMSSGTYCIIRDLGLVKGGKGMRHHEVLITFSPRAFRRWVVTAGRDLASAVKRRWLSLQREPQRFGTDVPTIAMPESTSQPLQFARSPMALSARRASTTNAAPPATPIADVRPSTSLRTSRSR
jgi:hypothetical protein